MPKKIIFVIVEGPSDDDSLGIFFDKYYDNYNVEVKVMHCDITTKKGVTITNILSKVADVVKEYAENNHLKREHFKEIIHIVDTDGVYVSNDIVVEDESVKETTYSLDSIRCKNKNNIIKRNEQKRKNIDKLINCGQIWTSIPYKIYYMSTNLEHVLHDIQNATDDEKEELAYQFLKKYKNDLYGFLDYICDSSFSVNKEYLDSWSFIKKGNNSLSRYTNLCLCFNSNKGHNNV